MNRAACTGHHRAALVARLISVLSLAALTSCRPGTPAASPEAPAYASRIAPDTLDGGRALTEVARFLEVGQRDAGTPGALNAAHYLKARLETLGIDATIDEFVDAVPDGQCTFRNVVGTLPGRSAQRVILLSHYDTKTGIGPDFIGANDSGSSSGLLLELARVLKQAAPHEATIQFLFVDGEECRLSYAEDDGLHGSRHAAAQLRRTGQARQVLAVLVLDMIGDRDLAITIPRNGTPELTALAFRAAREQGVRERFSLLPSFILDDQAPFLEVGIPAIAFIDFTFGSAPDKNDYWHTPADTLDKLSAESLETIGRVVLRMLNLLPTHGQG